MRSKSHARFGEGVTVLRVMRNHVLYSIGFTGDAEIAVNKANWDRIKDALREKGSGGQATDYQGNPTIVEYGKGTAKIVGFETEVEKLIIYAGSEDDLLGSNFFHNFPNLEMKWSFRDKTMTLTEISEDSADNEEQETGHKETEDSEEKMDKNKSFKREFEQNKAFYQEAKNFLRENFCGRYVIIGAG